MARVICVVGPTASGKTALAVQLALRLDGEIVSCDSMQLYRGMDIGTAKPTPQERQGIPHHMLDVAAPDENYSVSCFVQQADACVQDILARGKTAILAGGTGLYIDALVAGRSFAPYPTTGKREALERRADLEGIEPLLRELRAVDPEAAQRLHPSDRKRIVRALEVYQETGETITAHNLRTQAITPKYHPCWLGLDFEDRQVLYERINRRVEVMLRDGLMQEVRGLLAQGVPMQATAMQAIGYKEAVLALCGSISEQEAAARIRQASRNYAKRQLTWFRRNPEIRWIRRAEGQPEAEIIAEACANVTAFDKENTL